MVCAGQGGSEGEDVGEERSSLVAGLHVILVARVRDFPPMSCCAGEVRLQQ